MHHNDSRPSRAQHRASTEAGFTLLELLVVIAILALIGAFAAPEVFKVFGGDYKGLIFFLHFKDLPIKLKKKQQYIHTT